MEQLDHLIVKYPNSSLLVTGHSLGGAVSTISTADLYTSKYSEKFTSWTVYTIGQPRVGNDIFAKWVSGFKGIDFYRVVNENDIVPHRNNYQPNNSSS
jgi:predicted lipase